MPGAHYYLLEADDEPSFTFPHPLSMNPMMFGTKFGAGWGNEIPNIYYRVRAVSADNVIGLPSPVLTVHIVNTAPVPSAPTPLLPATGLKCGSTAGLTARPVRRECASSYRGTAASPGRHRWRHRR